MLLPFLFLLSNFHNGFAQERPSNLSTYRLYGYVLDGLSKEPLSEAIIAVTDTLQAAVTNKEGRYSIDLPVNTDVTLRVSAIGYTTDSFTINLQTNEERLITLRKEVNSLPTIITDGDRLAKEVVGQAIAKKKVWQQDLKDYTLQLYGRRNNNQIRSGDTTFISFLETALNGYWKKDKGYSEQVLARNENTNPPSAVKDLSLPEAPAFYHERVWIDGIPVPAPLAEDAFKYYHFTVMGEEEIHGIPAYKIAVAPLSEIDPAFEGTIWIGKTDNALTYLELSANQAATVSPVSSRAFHQSYQLVGGKYWLPVSAFQSAGIGTKASLAPIYYVEQSSVVKGYAVNQGLADNYFRGDRYFITENANTLDTTKWSTLRSIPLMAYEDKAYHRTFDKRYLLGRNSTFGPSEYLLSLLLDPAAYQYNRVEGSRIQIHPQVSHVGSWPLSIDALAAYSTGRDRFSYDVELRQGLLWEDKAIPSFEVDSRGILTSTMDREPRTVLDLGARVYDDVERRGKTKSILMNTLTGLLYKGDYPNYYQKKGFEVSSIFAPTEQLQATLGYREERQQSLGIAADFSLFSKEKNFRPNPAINDGLLRAVSSRVAWYSSSDFWSTAFMIEGTAAPAFLKGNFDFSTLEAGFFYERELGGFGLFSTWVSAATKLSGALGNQHLYYFESPYQFTARTRRFLTMHELEYQGDNIAMLFLEHDLRDLPERMVGINLLQPLDLHWIVFSNVGYSSLSESTKNFLVSSVKTTGDIPYVEAGVGIANILNILRLDVAWRVTHRIPGSNFTIKDTWSLHF